MSKYFKTKKEFDKYINAKFNSDTLLDMLAKQGPTDEEIIDALITDGYTDLNNLVEDGHAYQIGEHTNNGWIYEDEADIAYMESQGIKREIRKR